MPTTTKKIALVTGANKGIGFEVARQLAASGCTVLLGARNQTLGEDAAGKLAAEGLDVRDIAIDLTLPTTIIAAASRIAADFDHLDILVNNAGIATPGDGPPTASSLDAIEKTLRVNFLGSVAVTQAMLPLLRKAPSGRIVNVSSGLGSLTQNGDPAWPYAAHKYLGYSASKAALNMLTVQLAYELRDTAIKVNSADPGYTATDLNGHSGTQTILEGAAEAIRLALLPEDGPTGTYSDSKGVVPW
ncbi:MAG TPA: SDR family oxidoreductase [Bryobacteraceae bacterium]|jgi:NAD(P)-dependent dehydrogenase (short-subunit alcohol dehydrogenase family)